MDTLARLTALYECTRALGVHRDLDALLDEVLARTQELVGFEHGALLLYDAEHGELVLRRERGSGTSYSLQVGARLSLERGLAGWAARQRRPVRVGDVQREPRYVSGLNRACSNLAVPLLVRNELVGVLSVESPRPDAFTEEHEKLCTVVGTQAALAIDATRSRERLEQRLAELDALYRMSRLAAEPRDLQGVLAGLLDAAVRLLPPGWATLLLLDTGARALIVRASHGDGALALGTRVALGNGVAGRCAQLGQAVLVGDASPGAQAAAGRARSEVAVPLLVEGRLAGVLAAGSSQAHAYSREHGRTLAMLAQQAALVLGASQLRDELHRLAITDALTGLFNRRHFMRELSEHLRRVRRYRGRLALVVLDLDGFKPLNDRHGHPAGDRALQALAEIMRHSLRDTDVLARLGGDEFAALLLEADAPMALQVVERLRRSVQDAPLEGASVTVSGGLALFPEHGLEAEALLAFADKAMYEAKRLGRNRVVLA
jgi:diguanylate cyclase (GGDEF)-like protein